MIGSLGREVIRSWELARNRPPGTGGRTGREWLHIGLLVLFLNVSKHDRFTIFALFPVLFSGSKFVHVYHSQDVDVFLEWEETRVASKVSWHRYLPPCDQPLSEPLLETSCFVLSPHSLWKPCRYHVRKEDEHLEGSLCLTHHPLALAGPWRLACELSVLVE